MDASVLAVALADDGEDGDAARARLALHDLVSLPATRYPHGFAPRVWELRSNLTPYDAAYVALAESLGCMLVTADARLARAPGIRCAVEALPAAA